MSEQRKSWREYWGAKSWQAKCATMVALVLAVFQIYTALFGSFDAIIQRAIHLGLGLILLFLVRPGLILKKGKTGPSWLDWVFLAFSGAATAYLIVNYDWVTEERFPLITKLSAWEMILGIGMVLIVLEATRRMFNKGLFFVVLAFLIYPFVGPYLWGAFHTSPLTFSDMVDFNYLSLGGIFGIPLGVSATEIALFVIFGAVLLHSGGAKLFSNLATTLTGNMVGGPAKVAVVASSLMGTITGSGAANVATTGVVTIPMMKKAGYRPEFAGAVEAVASCGGQLMPPVMGAAAFVMSAFSGIPYSTIIYYALFPAVLYFISVFITVDLEARKHRLPGLKVDITPGQTMRDYGHMLIPLGMLVYMLVGGYSPSLAGGVGVISALVICQFRETTRLNPAGILNALEAGCKGMLIVTISTAAAGIIVGSVDLTGLGNRLGTVFVDLAGGHLLLGLFMAMIIALVLGAGMPTTPAYIVQVATVIPALMALGLPAHVAHLFAFYFSCLSLISPPVAAAAFTAAAIADADGWKTGWAATRIGIVAFVVPFMFAYEQSLLLEGPIGKMVLDMSTAILGAGCFAVAGVGYLLGKLNTLERGLAFIIGILLIMPVKAYSLAGLALLVLLVLWQLYRRKKSPLTVIPQ
ncbi:MAG: TRAP transporter fused permease subunit [Desulfarculaceae bacterium]|nr:TRAP transporter fused permease subunit [Desulfarculaceae bacterium]MCF8046062.1 TRAP transporter fused permease subunit [Desulfarculaceae bacterium]MCF8064157.1 TRAP transporter fused permease subunit [Desulfarculaceae bacterium]MCF8098521.1 TRAP transporter fused permease subunit [Desulfarculaceae bacterium]MCF8121234.1 TRAP transporter fused permease subunit [Desulfarculaceae bacterium]